MGRVPLPRPLLYPAGNSPPAPEGYRTQRESDASKCEARELVTGTGEDVVKGGSLRNPRGQKPRTQNPEPVDLHGRGLGTMAALLSPLWASAARLRGAGTGSHRGSAETWSSSQTHEPC